MHVILLMELKWTKIHTVVFKRDPVRQGHRSRDPERDLS